jgi:ribosomal protein S18 acetylase RimI-like enzyme
MSGEEIVVRKYKRFDYPALHRIFLQNTPHYFDESQAKALSAFMDRNAQNYHVLLIGNEVIGGGGYTINYFKTAVISWLMFVPQYQNRGLGTMLLRQIIKEIRSDKKSALVEALSTQRARGLFTKLNFTLVDVKPNFWADGLDLHKFQLKLKLK